MKKKPAHWLSADIVILVRALYQLGVRRKTIAAMTGVSDTGITHYVTRCEPHRTQRDIPQPGKEDLREAARLLAEHVIARRERKAVGHELPRITRSTVSEALQ